MIKSQELMKDRTKILINNQEGKDTFLIYKGKNKLNCLKDLIAECAQFLNIRPKTTEAEAQ